MPTEPIQTLQPTYFTYPTDPELLQPYNLRPHPTNPWCMILCCAFAFAIARILCTANKLAFFRGLIVLSASWRREACRPPLTKRNHRTCHVLIVRWKFLTLGSNSIYWDVSYSSIQTHEYVRHESCIPYRMGSLIDDTEEKCDMTCLNVRIL